MTSDYFCLIGTEIVCECVTHNEIPNPNKEQMIIDRPIKLIFYHKSKKRTGKLCLSYINSMIKYINPHDKVSISNSDERFKDVKINLKEKRGFDYQLLFKGKILGKKLVGECSKVKRKDLIPNWSAPHGGQRVTFSCNNFSVCYTEQPANIPFSII